MGQLIEWPEVITEGKDLEECRAMLRDALYEMVAAYKQLGNERLVIGNTGKLRITQRKYHRYDVDRRR
jgi:predicted RNase H-like HicB family nuclease